VHEDLACGLPWLHACTASRLIRCSVCRSAPLRRPLQVLDLLQSTATQSGAVPPATYVEVRGEVQHERCTAAAVCRAIATSLAHSGLRLFPIRCSLARFSAQSSGLSSAEVSSCIQALSFIFRILVQQQLSGEQTAALLQKETDLSDEKRQTLAQLWTDYNKVR